MKLDRLTASVTAFTVVALAFLAGLTIGHLTEPDAVATETVSAPTLSREEACNRLGADGGAMIAAVPLVMMPAGTVIGLDDGLSTKALVRELVEIRDAVAADKALRAPLEEAVAVAEARAIWLHYPGKPWTEAPRFAAAARDLGAACGTSFAAVYDQQ